MFRAALALAREIHERREEAAALRWLARVQLDLGAVDEARALLEESIPATDEVGDRHGIADSLEIAAAVAAAEGSPVEAAQLLGAAEAVRTSIGAHRVPDTADWYERTRARVEELATPEVFDREYRIGLKLSPDEALGLVGSVGARGSADTMTARGTAGSAVRHGPSGTSRLRPRARRARAPRRARGRRCRRARASPSRRCRCCSRRSTSELERGRSSCLLPEDADARDAAEAAAWFLGDERGRASCRAAASRWESGLEPPPHLVGERARALDVLARGGLVCASALALAEALPPPRGAARADRVAPGDEPGVDGLAEALALAGYERVERVEERGQFAVRGGIVDVFPTTGREPLRIELFGDEIEAIRAFSPFTQRALHSGRRGDRSTRPPSGASTSSSRAARDDEDDAPAPVPDDLVPPLDRAARPRLAAGRGARGLGGGGARAELVARRRDRARPVPAGPAVRVRGAAAGDRRARARRGRERARGARPRGPARRRRVPAPRRGAAHAEPAAPGRGARCSSPATSCRTSRSSLFAVAPARRGFVWRDLGLALLPDTQVFRRRAPRGDRARSAARSQSFADLRTGDYVVHEDHGVGQLLGFETKRSPASRATTSCSRSAATTASTSRTSRSARSRATSAPTRRRPRSRSSAARPGRLLKSRARESVRELAGELIALYAQRQTREGVAYDLDQRVARAARGRASRTARPPDQERAIEAVKEDLEAPRPMDRLVCGDVGFGKTEVARARRVRRRRRTASRC